jgi:hypothetical protein
MTGFQRTDCGYGLKDTYSRLTQPKPLRLNGLGYSYRQ